MMPRRPEACMDRRGDGGSKRGNMLNNQGRVREGAMGQPRLFHAYWRLILTEGCIGRSIPFSGVWTPGCDRRTVAAGVKAARL